MQRTYQCLILLPLLISSWAFSGRFDGSHWILAASTLPLLLALCIVTVKQKITLVCFCIYILPWIVLLGIMIFSYYNPAFFRFEGGGYLSIPHYKDWPSCVYPEGLLYKMALWGSLIITGWGAYMLPNKRNILRGILWLCLFNAFLLAVVGIYLKISHNPLVLGIAQGPKYYFSSFPYKNHWASYAILAQAIAAALFLYSFKKSLREGNWMSGMHYLAFSMGAFLFLSVGMCGSRLGIALNLCLVFIVSIRILTMVIWGKNKTHRKAPILISLFLLLSLLGSLSYYFSKNLALSEWNRMFQTIEYAEEGKLHLVEKRQLIYRDTYKMFQQKPLWGWGLGSFPEAFPAFKGNDYGRSYTILFAHNDWLEILTEIGIVGISLLLLPILALLIRYLVSRELNIISNWLLIGICIISLHAIIDFPLGNPAILYYVSILFALALKYSKLNKKRIISKQELNSTLIRR